MPAGVIIFGASSGTGLEVARLLAARRERVTAFVRPTSDRRELDRLDVDYAVGDILDADSVEAAFATTRCRAIVNTVGGRRAEPRPDFQGVKNMVAAARDARVRRVVLVTAIGTGDSRQAVGERTWEVLGRILEVKTRGEECLMASGLHYTILRPGGLTHGPATGSGIKTEDHTVMGSISRAELAALVVECLDDAATVGKIYHAIDPVITELPPLER